MILCRTPYRVSFFGGGTDLPGWTDAHEGAVLSMAIDKYCWIMLRKLPPHFPSHKHRIVYGKVEEVDRFEDIQHPAARACLMDFAGGAAAEDGVELYYSGDLPSRSGIGSSSSFTVGLINALHGLQGGRIEPNALAVEAIRIESKVLKSQLGMQDQVAAAFGGFNRITLSAGRFSVQPVPVGRNFFTHLLFVYLGPRQERHEQSKTLAPHHFRMLASMVDEGVKHVISEDMKAFGSLLDEAWRVKREFGDVATPEIDARYEAAKKAGAYGGKLCGAGGGGFMILVVDPDRKPDVVEAMGNPGFVSVRLDQDGSQIVYMRREL